jgi:hypothetical protein
VLKIHAHVSNGRKKHLIVWYIIFNNIIYDYPAREYKSSEGEAITFELILDNAVQPLRHLFGQVVGPIPYCSSRTILHGHPTQKLQKTIKFEARV